MSDDNEEIGMDDTEKKRSGYPRRVHVVNDNDKEDRLTPKHLAKQEFGRRLYKLMLARGLTQSELARRAGIQRDSVSTYIRGKTSPTDANLHAMARALNVKPEELLPNMIESAITADAPALEIRSSVATPGLAWLRVDRMVSMHTATQIMNLLEADEAVNATGSR